MTDVNLINADVLTVGPEEKLVISIQGEFPDGVIADLMAELDTLGLRDRCLVFHGVDATFAKVSAHDHPIP
jgi:hypothetical protein